MHKKIPYKSIVIVTLILGVFISLQLKSINIENHGVTTIKRGEQLLQELQTLKKEEQTLQSEVNTLKEDIQSYKNYDGSSELKDEIKYYEKLAGYTDINGEGINITIESLNNSLNEDSSNSINYNFDLLLSIINKLNAAQAKAISVNNIRIVYDSYFHLENDDLYINNMKIQEPFEIKAIGNPDTLSSALQIKYGIIWEIETYYNAKVKIEKSDNIKIKASKERNYLKGVDYIEKSEN